MSKVFVDTVGFLALWDERDQWHQAAITAFERARQSHMELVSSYFIFLELGNASARKPYRDLVWTFRTDMEADRTLIPITGEQWSKAWQRFHDRYANSAGFVDQTSFLVLEQLGIKSALTNDDHFRAAGFEILM